MCIFILALGCAWVQALSYMHMQCLKKNKGKDVPDFDCMMIFSEQDNANYFLLISLYSLNTGKFQNRQNNLFLTKANVWGIPLKAIFSISHTAFSGDQRCHCFISFSSFIRSEKNMSKRMNGVLRPVEKLGSFCAHLHVKH